MTPIDIPSTQVSQDDFAPPTVLQFPNHVVSRLSDKKTAEYLFINYASNFDVIGNDIALYTLHQSYKGGARQLRILSAIEAPSSTHVGQHMIQFQKKYKLLESSYMLGPALNLLRVNPYCKTMSQQRANYSCY